MSERLRAEQRGFTLVELSIVLVIIGLIVGGVLVGRDLVEAAKVRNVVAQLKSTQAAVNTFLGKYGGLPGDLQEQRAQQFNLTAAVCSGGDILGCNGNNDGVIRSLGGEGGNAEGRLKFNGEIRNLWYHLQVADYSPGAMNGANVIGEGFPKTALTGVGIHAGIDTTQIPALQTQLSYFTLGAVTNDASDTIPDDLVFVRKYMTSQIAYKIDSIIDDGLPGVATGGQTINATGVIHARSGAQAQFYATNGANGDPNCATAATNTYNLLSSGPACQLRVRMGKI